MESKTYKLIYADPPWPYTKRPMDKGKKKITEGTMGHNHAENHYATMNKKELVEEIGSLIEGLADPIGCLAFIWITNTHFPMAIELMERAGFQWVTMGFVWNKVNPNLGAYTNSQCEFVGIFKKGKPFVSLGKVQNPAMRQYFMEKKTVHSRKPKGIRDNIAELFPTVSKIELFARERTEGWDVWGNEVDKFSSPEEATVESDDPKQISIYDQIK